MKNLLNPDSDFSGITTIEESDWKIAQREARKKIINTTGPIRKDVLEHLYNITNGIVPFGLKVVDDKNNEVQPTPIPFENEEGDEFRNRIGYFNWQDKEKELVKIMLDICLHDNNKDSFTEEQFEMMENWKSNI
jgi:hypothetical protein